MLNNDIEIKNNVSPHQLKIIKAKDLLDLANELEKAVESKETFISLRLIHTFDVIKNFNNNNYINNNYFNLYNKYALPRITKSLQRIKLEEFSFFVRLLTP